MAQQIVEARRFEIDRTVRRKRRALVVARDAVFIHERTILGCIRACGWLRPAVRAVGARSLRDQRRADTEDANAAVITIFLAMLSGILIARLSPPPLWDCLSFPYRRFFLCP